MNHSTDRGSGLRDPILAAVVLVLAGCVNPQLVNAEAALPSLPIEVRDGVTTREDILLVLGIPSAEFEDQRILTYMLRGRSDKLLAPVSRHVSPGHPQFADWGPTLCHLILVFDENDVVQRHRLLRTVR